MSNVRRQAQIDAPVERVWDLVGDPNRHPEWWPRVIEAKCDGIEEGCEYRWVAKGPVGEAEETVLLEQLDDCSQIRIRCLDTGTYMHWALTSVRDGTFIDVEFGMEPARIQHRVFDRLAGRRFYRRWLEESLEGLRRACGSQPPQERAQP